MTACCAAHTVAPLLQTETLFTHTASLILSLYASCFCVHPLLLIFSVSRESIWKLRVDFLQERVLNQWESFTIWNAGKQGRKLYRCLSKTNQKKVCYLQLWQISCLFLVDGTGWKGLGVVCECTPAVIAVVIHLSGEGFLWRWREQDSERLLHIWGIQGEINHCWY